MNRYSICTESDEEVFRKQCDALEKRIKALTKDQLLSDVDGSLIQVYYLDGKKIKVVNSYFIGSVYIESEVDIEPFFEDN